MSAELELNWVSSKERRLSVPTQQLHHLHSWWSSNLIISAFLWSLIQSDLCRIHVRAIFTMVFSSKLPWVYVFYICLLTNQLSWAIKYVFTGQSHQTFVIFIPLLSTPLSKKLAEHEQRSSSSFQPACAENALSQYRELITSYFYLEQTF